LRWARAGELEAVWGRSVQASWDSPPVVQHIVWRYGDLYFDGEGAARRQTLLLRMINEEDLEDVDVAVYGKGSTQVARRGGIRCPKKKVDLLVAAIRERFGEPGSWGIVWIDKTRGRASKGRAVRRDTRAADPLRVRGGTEQAGYFFDAYFMTADEGISVVIESLCESVGEDDENCWEDVWPYLPGIHDENKTLVVYIDKLYFAPTRRGVGWGRKFVRALERWGKKHGAFGVLLHSGVLWGGPEHSFSFWDKMGFESVTDYGDDSVMWKELS
jgi:GNAT superfamily N-acetyltransferase